MSAIIARIALRYLSGALVAAGYLNPDLGAELGVDPDLAMLVGTAIAAGTELAYAIARKMGWSR